VLGTTLDAVPTPAPVDEVVTDRVSAWRRRPAEDTVADEPLTAEREAATPAEPHTVTVGPRSERATEMVE
jgi:hypothetical protein